MLRCKKLLAKGYWIGRRRWGRRNYRRWKRKHAHRRPEKKEGRRSGPSSAFGKEGKCVKGTRGEAKKSRGWAEWKVAFQDVRFGEASNPGPVEGLTNEEGFNVCRLGDGCGSSEEEEEEGKGKLLGRLLPCSKHLARTKIAYPEPGNNKGFMRSITPGLICCEQVGYQLKVITVNTTGWT